MLDPTPTDVMAKSMVPYSFLVPWALLMDSSSRSVLGLARNSWSLYGRLAKLQATEWISWSHLGIEQTCEALSAWSSLAERLRTDCTKRVALVAGADCVEGQAIGAELAEAGYQVVCTRTPQGKRSGLMTEQYYQVSWLDCNLSDLDSCMALSRHIAEKYGGVDIIVNCLGSSPRSSMRLNADAPKGSGAVINAELDRTFNVARSFVDGMVSRHFGRIVSILPSDSGQTRQSSYTSVRAAVLGFSRSLAVELVDAGVTVNSICLTANPESTWQRPVFEPAQVSTSWDHLDDPKRIASTVLSLVSESSNISGVNVHVPPKSLN